MGLVGLMNALKLEGAKYNIKVNTVAPIAATRLTQDILPPNLHDRLRPEFVAPLVLYLCSEQCPVNGRIYQAGGGVYGRAAVVSGPGVHLGEGEPPTPEEIAAHWQEILSLDGAREYPDANAALMAMLTAEQGTGEQAEQESEEAGKQRGAVRAVFERLPDRFQAGRRLPVLHLRPRRRELVRGGEEPDLHRPGGNPPHPHHHPQDDRRRLPGPPRRKTPRNAGLHHR